MFFTLIEACYSNTFIMHSIFFSMFFVYLKRILEEKPKWFLFLEVHIEVKGCEGILKAG